MDLPLPRWHICAMNGGTGSFEHSEGFRPHAQGVETVAPFRQYEPTDHLAPIVFSSPHSGRHYPDHFLAASRLDRTTLRASEDFFVDDLFAPCVEMGMPLIAANYPRAYVDLNREPFELDQRMFIDKLPGHANTRSVRVAGGLGTVARVVSENREIYAAPISTAEAFDRVEHVYRPFHDALRRTLARTHVAFGRSILIDCHSMPSGRLQSDREARTSAKKLKRKAPAIVRSGSGRAEFILGDRYGTSCAPELTDCVQACLRDMGYRVARNKPYAGGFITEHYGRPGRGLHALQIEINRALYVNEETQEPTEDFGQLRADLIKLMRALMVIGQEIDGETMPLAAE
ncbi:MAG: N-formylglutamate amidohydrolase [Pseudomonadota bacterium]